jgi:uncharacterized phage-associated protein
LKISRKTQKLERVRKKGIESERGRSYLANVPFFRASELGSHVDSIQLANYLLATVGPMPHLKLQKLVYYVQAWHLAFFEEPLIADDFQAWLHGPVSPRIWKQFKSDENPLLNQIVQDREIARRARAMFPQNLTAEQRDLIADVISEYGEKSAYHLECLTHSEKPWIDARKGVGIGDKSSNVIPKESMARFYRLRLRTAK